MTPDQIPAATTPIPHSPHSVARPAIGGGRGGKRQPRRMPPRPNQALRPRSGSAKALPALESGNIRIIPLGGVEEVGKNMTAVEYEGDILVVDMGFTFPNDDTPGVDYIIPDATYLETNKHRIKGVIITHAHLDHIGGIPYIMPKIGNPPLYTTLLSAVMIKKRQEEFPQLPALDIQTIEPHQHLTLGHFKIRFFTVTHTIPDSFGVIIDTPYGNLIFTGDIKIDTKDNIPVESEFKTFEKLGKEKTLLLVAESTNVEKPGFSYPEREVQENLRQIIADVPGRIVIGTFASMFERIVYMVQASENLGKKVVIEGRSMRNNVEIAKELGILKVRKETIIPAEQIGDYPENKIVILATGAQGDEFAALMRMSTKEHKHVKLKKGDTILLSSSVIPGNEKSVQKLKDNLSRQGAKIIHYGIADVHSSGHSYQGELEWIHKMLKPKFFIPVHGHHSMLRVHADMAVRLGVEEKNAIVPDNGMVIEIADQGGRIFAHKETVSSKVVMVDGLGAGNVQEVVIRDRQALAQDGMFVIIAMVDLKTGQVRKSPDIISRGFIYLKESQDLLRQVRSQIKKVIEDSTRQMNPINFDYVKNAIREDVGKYLFQKTHKRPIILPVLIEV
ncbi:MAG: ribonuclease J [Candidatus Vogelbacteria bacterium]|nr:ribonuclease J [Candidatus Vogelbacteria bacterium]